MFSGHQWLTELDNVVVLSHMLRCSLLLTTVLIYSCCFCCSLRLSWRVKHIIIIISFETIPPQTAIPPMRFSAQESEVITKELQALLQKEVIRPATTSGGFVSNIFTVPKSNGKVRLILNLKKLNTFVTYEHFKMEDVRCVKDLLNQNEFMCKLDLRDAYLTVPVQTSHQTFLRFQWQGKVYQYTALPFGLASAPRVFTKLMKPVLACLRAKGIRVVAYLDDFLIIGRTISEAEAAYRDTKQLMETLGFVVNEEKSEPRAVQQIEFLGFMINSCSMTIYLPSQKIKSIKQRCSSLLRDQVTTVRKLSQVIGMLVATKLAVLPAPLHYRALQQLKIEGLHRHHSYESIVTLNYQSTRDLQWWVTHLKAHNGRPIVQPPPSLIIESDASNTGWGAHCNSHRTGGQWSFSEATLHINAKELLASFLALQTFARDRQGIHVHLKIDNVTAVYFINRLGGTHSSTLMNLTYEMWSWCLQREIFLSAEHLPGKLNLIADQESRSRADSSEWKLDPIIFQQIMRILGPCHVDLFASRLTAQLPAYMSWKPDPGSVATDAMSQDWSQGKCYAFPPFSLIGRCLAKVQREKVPELVLIVPLWPTQPWFPVLLSVMIREPVQLPNSATLLLNPNKEPHPLVIQQSLKLAAWLVSGLPCKVREFHKKLQK